MTFLSKFGKLIRYRLHDIHPPFFAATAVFAKNVLEVNHKDGDKKNNSLNNLEYVTHSQNQLHSYRVLKTTPVRSWLGKKGFEHNKSIHILIINVETGETKAYGSYRLAHENGFNRQLIRKCIDTNKL